MFYSISIVKKGKELRKASKQNKSMVNDETDGFFKRILKSLGYSFSDDRIFLNPGMFALL